VSDDVFDGVMTTKGHVLDGHLQPIVHNVHPTMVVTLSNVEACGAIDVAAGTGPDWRYPLPKVGETLLAYIHIVLTTLEPFVSR
jgi:hypothetical protein